MGAETFATAINCMDGRTQTPIAEFLKIRWGVDYIDMITEPGPNRILADGLDHAAIESIRRRVDVSKIHHGSRRIAIVGHHACAGNPADRDTQISHIRAAIDRVRSWGIWDEIIGLWVDESWAVQEVA
jgi:hypothetical protein